jgi:DNA uptake protein ComE-like DNA-binding protein
MEKPFRQVLKEYFSFMKKDRNGFIVLTSFILLLIAAHIVINTLEFQPAYNFTEIEKAFAEWEKMNVPLAVDKTLFEFDPNLIAEKELDSLSIPIFVKRNILNYRTAGGKFSRAEDIRRIYGMTDSLFAMIEPYLIFPAAFPDKIKHEKKPEEISGFFDPNDCSLNHLLQFGFNQFQAFNVLKYIESGGRFTTSADLLKIYGIDSAFFNKIKKNVHINYITEVLEEEIPVPAVTIELNTADSLELIRMQGIGPVFASRILKYRNLLGGFYSSSQLLEVYGFPEETFHNLKENILVDTLIVKKLRINFNDFSDLVRHPYLKQHQVEAILSHRRENGPFNSNEQILSSGLLDSVSYMNIRPYLTCR